MTGRVSCHVVFAVYVGSSLQVELGLRRQLDMPVVVVWGTHDHFLCLSNLVGVAEVRLVWRLMQVAGALCGVLWGGLNFTWGGNVKVNPP